MNDRDLTASGIENTSARDPLLQFAGLLGGTDRYITEMESAGQRQLVNSTQLPTEMNSGTDDDLRAMGFELGDPNDGDPMFRNVTLPDGWSKQATDHAMWSKVVDEHGRARLKVFYKAAFYDRRAFINVQAPVGYMWDVIGGEPLVLDDTWATRDALRAEAEKYRADNAGRAERYGDEDGYYAEQVAAADRLLSQLDGA